MLSQAIKCSVLVALVLGFFHSSPSIGGVRDSGGGDLCEDRIKTVRDDIKNWIQAGGPKGLTLPAGVDVDQYSTAMLQQIGIAKISCVGSGDRGFPVTIDGTPKVCRFDKTQGQSQITCDYDKFQAISESDQYVLVHHEYAGLAGFEPPNGDDSTYTLSNQISGFLTDETVKKLAVKPSSSADDGPSPTVQGVFVAISDQISADNLDCDNESIGGIYVLENDGSYLKFEFYDEMVALHWPESNTNSSPLYMYSANPDSSAIRISTKPGPEPVITVTNYINAQGFLDDSYTHPKPGDSIREMTVTISSDGKKLKSISLKSSFYVNAGTVLNPKAKLAAPIFTESCHPFPPRQAHSSDN